MENYKMLIHIDPLERRNSSLAFFKMNNWDIPEVSKTVCI